MGLAGARWITADMAYRRAALAETGGFDERFPRAFREDADLALRLLADGWELGQGSRQTVHPVRPASPWVSVRAQAGNADDALMRVLHGRRWKTRAQAGRDRLPSQALITAAVAAGAGLAAAGRRGPALAALAAALAGVAEFAAARIAPGPRTAREVAAMTATSLVIPELACWHWARGRIRARRARPWPRARAVLFDRDGTLIRDVPYNGDPALVEPMPAAAAAVAAARRQGLRVGLITNQSGIARGLLSRAAADAVNARVAALARPVRRGPGMPARPGGRLRVPQARARHGARGRDRPGRGPARVHGDRRHRGRCRRGPGRPVPGASWSPTRRPGPPSSPASGWLPTYSAPYAWSPATCRWPRSGRARRHDQALPGRPAGQHGRRAAGRAGHPRPGRALRPGDGAGRAAGGGRRPAAARGRRRAGLVVSLGGLRPAAGAGRRRARRWPPGWPPDGSPTR